MRKLFVKNAELLAAQFRSMNGLSLIEPISVKTLLRKLQITAMYRPLSEHSYGISCKSVSGKMFMLINSNSTRGRQHFTIAHELYHLYYEESPEPHFCVGDLTGVEKDANLFASALLMPEVGILPMVSADELKVHKVELSTILRLEQYFSVSRNTLLVRLKDIELISEEQLEKMKKIPVKDSAREYGYDLSLYEPGNAGLVIGDFGEKARILFETGKISEGHYQELLKLITNGSE